MSLRGNCVLCYSWNSVQKSLQLEPKMINGSTMKLVFAFSESPGKCCNCRSTEPETERLKLAFFAEIQGETYLLEGRASRPKTACKSTIDS